MALTHYKIQLSSAGNNTKNAARWGYFHRFQAPKNLNYFLLKSRFSIYISVSADAQVRSAKHI